MNGEGRGVSWEGQGTNEEDSEGWDGKRLGSSALKDDVQQGLGSESDTRNQSGEEGLRSGMGRCEEGCAYRNW